jgi:hypothetical protein
LADKAGTAGVWLEKDGRLEPKKLCGPFVLTYKKLPLLKTAKKFKNAFVRSVSKRCVGVAAGKFFPGNNSFSFQLNFI